MQADVVGQRQPQLSAHAFAEVIEGALCVVRGHQQPARMGQKLTPGLGEQYAASDAIEQAAVELRLQYPQAFADCRLGEMQGPRGGLVAAVVADGDEGPNGVTMESCAVDSR
ncbi:MAG: hypothetical protein L0H83_16080, partial [Salinisphaera sp.]|nr:hypothetical protein [Salinisphaera sp.]